MIRLRKFIKDDYVKWSTCFECFYLIYINIIEDFVYIYLLCRCIHVLFENVDFKFKLEKM